MALAAARILADQHVARFLYESAGFAMRDTRVYRYQG
jgi:hypothetical protein